MHFRLNYSNSLQMQIILISQSFCDNNGARRLNTAELNMPPVKNGFYYCTLLLRYVNILEIPHAIYHFILSLTNSRTTGPPPRAEAAQLITIYRKKIYVPLQTPIIRSSRLYMEHRNGSRTNPPNECSEHFIFIVIIIIITTLVYKALLCLFVN